MRYVYIHAEDFVYYLKEIAIFTVFVHVLFHLSHLYSQFKVNKIWHLYVM